MMNFKRIDVGKLKADRFTDGLIDEIMGNKVCWKKHKNHEKDMIHPYCEDCSWTKWSSNAGACAEAKTWLISTLRKKYKKTTIYLQLEFHTSHPRDARWKAFCDIDIDEEKFYDYQEQFASTEELAVARLIIYLKTGGIL